nr:ABC transporter permease [Allomuricauda sp.]
MLKLFLKIATRYLFKNRLYSFINITGLAIGIASFMLIMVYVNYEKSYDTFNGSDTVYRVYMDYMEGDKFVAGDAQTYNLSGPTLKEAFPEIQEQARLYHLTDVTLAYEDVVLSKNRGSLADPSYMDIFPLVVQQGKRASMLEAPYSIVLTETLAKKLFGNENPIGKPLSVFWGSMATMTVSAVLQDLPQNTHMKNSFFISFNTFWKWEMFGGQQKLNWEQNNFFTYIKVDENASIADLKQKVQQNNADGQDDERHNIEPVEDIHLYSNKPYEAEINGSISRVNFLIAIAFIIIILSWVNYINLSTTKSMERSKETGIRKVVGAKYSQLMAQFFVESLLLNVIAILLAIGICVVLLPFFNGYMDKNLSIDFSNIQGLLHILAFVLLGALVSGAYPAFVLSNYSPIQALKGRARSSENGYKVRTGLITLQFLATIVLLIGTLVVTKQLKFMQDQSIGVELDQVIALNGQILENVKDSVRIKDFQVLREEVENLSFVKSASTAETYPGAGYDNLSSFMGITKPNGTFEEQTVFYQYQVQPKYFEVMGISLVAGEVFRTNPNGYGNDIVVNEQFVKDMDIVNASDAIGKQVKFWGQNWKIVGVMENYHHFGLKTAVTPMLVRPGTATSNLLVKLDNTALSPTGLTTAIATLKDKWANIFPKSTVDHIFLDKNFEAQYKDDQLFSSSFRIFTMLAIFIASLGLFGLTSYTCIQRKKEIGIRKVNGATIAQILQLLNQSFVKWVGLAFVMAVPIAWFGMQKWLEAFAYKTTMSWWIFVVAGFTALGIAIFTVSWQSFKVAIANPVDILRDE